MKNLMVFVSPTRSFNNGDKALADNDAGKLIKVQIDNSLKLGFSKKDILLVTNFDYEYNGIKALSIPDIGYVAHKPQASKINAIVALFENGKIMSKETYWFHDIDAFPLVAKSKLVTQLKNDEICVTDFGGAKKFMERDRLSGGVFYFKSGSYDIFKKLQEIVYQKKVDEEEALTIAMIDFKNIKKRVKKINNSYNFIGYNFESIYKKSLKPIKVVHFHPRTTKKRLGNVSGLAFFSGQNPLKLNLLPDFLLRNFKYHRIA